MIHNEEHRFHTGHLVLLGQWSQGGYDELRMWLV
jgi:hypothetical protein